MKVLKAGAALVLAVLVHAFTVTLLVTGGWIIARSPGFAPAWAAGGLLVAIGALLFPRPRRLPGDVEVVEPSAAPALYGLARRVAGAVGTAPPLVVAVSDLAVGCLYARVGWRRRPALVVGLPLWLVLSARHRVTLLARTYVETERDDLLVSGALWTLARWRESLMSGKPLTRRGETHMYMATVLGAAAPRGGYEAAGTLGQILGRLLGWPVLLLERALRGLVAAPVLTDSVITRTEAMESVATAAEVAWLDGLVEGRRFVAPLQAAALRGASVAEIRRSPLVAEDAPGTPATGGPSSMLTEAASDAIDDELSPHYARAMRSFGLIW
ncbi:hypothetical protein Skr01_67140 [Sphaerisporangium krabiense]|nr:hypothetical protein Skr01_67140 [Sphaerisporangium krabiense]